MTFKSQPLCDSISRDQVAAVVHEFYIKVLADKALAHHFAAIHDWPRHEGYITDFWWGVMGGQVAQPRPGAMLRSHQQLQFGPQAVARWLKLFNESIDALIPPAEAAQWQAMARGIATMMGEHDLVSDEEEEG
jgi:truncated hemoglobin YjbI